MNQYNDTPVFGIDLGTTYSCIAWVDEYEQPIAISNSEGDRITPSVVQFEDESRVVGKEAKNSAALATDRTVEMVKRHMGEIGWRFSYNGVDYTAETISSYILGKLVQDAELQLGRPVKDVVITCPAYFGIAQRDATMRAGEIAGLNVREVINEPTAAAIMYGMQNEQDQLVLVYDLGGGTFDITVIEITSGAITVIATGGDHYLGGRNWDEVVVNYLAEQWQAETGASESPIDSDSEEARESLQDLWRKAEDAKKSLTARPETKVPVSHEGQRVGIVLTRDKFNELTANLLERTIDFTKATMEEAKVRGYDRFEQILLVGGSTRMPQVAERLTQEFHIPIKMFDPDEAVAKGAAFYGRKLALDEKIQHKVAQMVGRSADTVDLSEVSPTVIERAQESVAREGGLKLTAVKKFNQLVVTNVASHSFGIVAFDDTLNKELIANLVLVNDPLPHVITETFYTLEEQQTSIGLRVMENNITAKRVDDLSIGQEIGNAVLEVPSGLPKGTPIEVTIELQRDGRLHMKGREPRSGREIEIEIQTEQTLSEEELRQEKARFNKIKIS